jgi:hypothetical protein
LRRDSGAVGAGFIIHLVPLLQATMPLCDLILPSPMVKLPRAVRLFLSQAEERIDEFRRAYRIPAFVPSDFVEVYGVLQALATSNLASGDAFCEWGSGFGVVTCLAAMLQFDACGIEIDHALVEAAEQLADDFDLAVEFTCGSFIPEGGDIYADACGFECPWLTTNAASGLVSLGSAPDEFDVIFAYPWPGEERVVENIFEHYAGVGALLLTYHGHEGSRLRRRTTARDSRSTDARD